jgi:GTP cyclohydrolase IA
MVQGNEIYQKLHPRGHANGQTNGQSDTHDHDKAANLSVGAASTYIEDEEGPSLPTPELKGGVESYDPHLEKLISQILTRVGEDPTRDGLKQTPLRVAKALDYLTSGYTADLSHVVNQAVFKDDSEEMVLVKNIEFYSLCEHHMLPFFGQLHIAYIPNGKIIGLSKLARVADVFARRLQVQERLTNQIADALEAILQPKGVAILAEAAHFCMMMRGVQKQNSTTLTSAMRGVFKEDAPLREQFMRMAQVR